MAGKGVQYQSSNLTANLSGGAYVALYLNDPGATNIGDEAGSYTRQKAEFGEPERDGNATGIPNSNNIVFPGKSGGYGTITHIAIMSAASGGELIYFNSLSEPIRSKDRETIEFPAGSLKVTEE